MPQSNEVRRETYKKNRESILVQQREYRAQHPEKAKEYNRRSYWKKSELRKAARKTFYLENKEVELERNRRYQDKNRDKIRRQRQKYYQENTDSILNAVSERYRKTRSLLDSVRRRMLARTKHRAKKLSLPFNLTLDDIIIPAVCPVFGRQFNLDATNSSMKDWSPSIDRIVPNIGYVRGNIQIISMRANAIKRDATLEELESLVRYLKEE